MAILDDLIRTHLGIQTFADVNKYVSSIETVKHRIVKSNHDRIGLVVVNNGASNVRILNSNAVTIENGLYVGPSGGTVTFDWYKDMSLISEEWWGIASGAASAVTIIELIGIPVEK